jgi:protein-disulfide isomerase
MHDLLFRRQNFLADQELVADAGLIGLDQERFRADLEARTGLARIEADLQSGERSGVDGTPGIFVNGRRHLQDYDPKTLAAALTAAAAPGRPR